MTSESCKYELNKLQKYLVYVQDKYKSPIIEAPFDINYIINFAISIQGEGGKNIKNRDYVIEKLRSFFKDLGSAGYPGTNNKMIKILVWFSLSSKKVVEKYKLTKESLDYILLDIRNKIINSLIMPGTSVGLLCTTSLSEVTQQGTLNTFHAAGVGSRSRVVQNLGTLKNLLELKKEMDVSSIYTTIYLKDEFKHDLEFVKNSIKYFNVNNALSFIKEKSLIRDDNLGSGDYPQDKPFIKTFLKNNTEPLRNLSRNSIRLQFKKKQMFNSRIGLSNIILTLYNNFPYVSVIPLGEHVLRMYIDTTMLLENKIKDVNEIVILKDIYNKIDKISFSGIDGIISASYIDVKTEKYDPETRALVVDKEYAIVTIGSNLLEVFKLDYVDKKRTISNNVLEVFELYGIETARRILLKGVQSNLLASDQSLSSMLLSFLVDDMTFIGSFIKRTSDGLKINPEASPLHKIAFEKQDKCLINAAIEGQEDDMRSIDANIMVCQKGPYGTGLCDVIIDNS